MIENIRVPFDAEAFLFDLDGVLIDTESVYSEIWKDIESHFPTGIENFDKAIKGTTLEDILARYFNNPEVRPQVEAMLLEAEKNMRYRYCDGALDLLAVLNMEGIPCALVTSSDDVKMAHLWQQMPELKPLFKVIIDGTQVTRSKPDPQGYLMAAERLGIDPRKCVVVEDSLQGVKAGRAAGAYVIGDVGTLPAETLAPFADLLVESLEELL